MIASMLAGSAWGLLNVWLIKKTLFAFLIGKDRRVTVGYLCLKFPLLYLAGYGLLAFGLDVLGLGIGLGVALVLGMAGTYAFAKY